MIEIRHLTKQFGEFTAVNDVSLTVQPGETFALLGPNGSGKTTALKCLVGLTVPTSGQVLINGLNAVTEVRAARSLLSYLPQQVSFHDNLTAREVMQFYCKLRKLPTTRIDKVLSSAQFGFNGFTDKPVGEFSGGMMQRLGIAVACLPDAPILLLDEPTASLDPLRAMEFRQFLQSLKAAGKTILFTSHMLADVEQLADRVAVLVSGKLVAIESISTLRKGLMTRHRLRVTLHHSSRFLAEVALQAGASEAVMTDESLLITACTGNQLPVLRALEEAGAQIAGFTTEAVSLEDIYVSYLNHEKTNDL
jgi:ABC-type multidrug transport system ATPase subunit